MRRPILRGCFAAPPAAGRPGPSSTGPSMARIHEELPKSRHYPHEHSQAKDLDGPGGAGRGQSAPHRPVAHQRVDQIGKASLADATRSKPDLAAAVRAAIRLAVSAGTAKIRTADPRRACGKLPLRTQARDRPLGISPRRAGRPSRGAVPPHAAWRRRSTDRKGGHPREGRTNPTPATLGRLIRVNPRPAGFSASSPPAAPGAARRRRRPARRKARFPN